MALSPQVTQNIQNRNAGKPSFSDWFQANNPQYSYKTPSGDQTAPQAPTPGMTSYTPDPVGAKAASPSDNLTPPTNTLPSSQTATAVHPFQGLIGSISSLASTPNPSSQSAQSGLLYAGQNPTPAQGDIQTLRQFSQAPAPYVSQAMNEYNQFAKQSPLLLSDVRNNPNVAAEVSVGRGNALGSVLSGEQNALAQNLSNALGLQNQQIGATQDTVNSSLAGQAQQLGALNSAAGLGLQERGQTLGSLQSTAGMTSPQQVAPGNFYVSPFSGQDITGGNVTPFSGGQRQDQVSQGRDYNTGLTQIQAGRSLTNQFNSLLQQTPGFNPSDVNVVNGLVQGYQNNTSNQYFPQLQTTFNNILNSYRPILGDFGLTTALSAAKGSTLSALIASLDQQATAVNESKKSVSTNQPLTPAPAPVAQSNTDSGQLPTWDTIGNL